MNEAQGGASAFSNWIPDTNRWNLPAPPQEALTKLREFDAQLVVLPSRFTRHYLLARRRLHSAGIGDVAMLDNKHPDTNMLYGYGLLPVSTIKSASGNFTWDATSIENIIAALRRRDTWSLTERTKDPDAAWKAVEEFEKAQEQKAARELRDKFYHMGRDAYRSLKARIGERFNPGGSARWAARRSKPSRGGTTH